jgi:Leucine-rich repeat (LRR) protein
MAQFPNILDIRYLKSLNLSHNRLNEIPEDISRLSRLINLDISYNFLTNIPRSIVEMASLEELNVSFNYLVMLQDLSIHLLTSLRNFDVSHNRIVILPFYDVMTSPSIKTFRFVDNRFPRDIYRILECYYTGSDALDLSGLALASLRKEVTLLTNLQDLSLRNNNFPAVPQEVGQLTNLTSLDLSYNHFKDLPLFIHRLKHLKKLNLEETKNYIENPPPRIVAGGLKNIMGYYNDLLSGEPCYRMKLMLVGQGKNNLAPNEILLLRYSSY